jgi:predicted TIM-barrel fold metal-dependent hydrolase
MISRSIRPIGFLLFAAFISPIYAGERPIFDVHIHYSHDVWDKISPQQAIGKLRAAGISRAMVSSSGDQGTQRLYQAAPELVVPVLRPYRTRDELDTWMHDQSVIPYLKSRLQKYRYVALGEFHVNGEDADTPVVRQMVQLAREHNLILHAHSDAEAIISLFLQYPEARIIWAHAGFEFGSRVKEMLDHYPNLWVDLSFRWEIFHNGRFLPVWRELLIEHADRFLLGIDTYTPQRWLQIQETLAWYEGLFAALPNEVAEKIRYQNARQLIERCH